LNRTLWHDEARFFRQEVLNFGNLYYAGGLAEEYRRAKDYKRARPLFEKAIENAPRRAEHYINYAALLIEVKEYAAAHALLERAEPLVLTHRQRAEWYNNKGVLHEREGEAEQAVRYFAAAVELAPRQPKVWANLGTSYMKAGDLDQAVAVLEEGLRAIPKSIRLTRILAIVRFRSGDCPGSMAVIEKLPRRHRGGSTDLNALLRTCQERLARDRQDASSQGEKGLSGVTPGPSGAKNHAEQ
jgi:tetratricopeptide (TPR) repeat protein